MRYCVYLLWSELSRRTYADSTEDIENRLKRHNSGYVRSMKAFRPWKLIHQEFYLTRSEAMKREIWLKSPSGRKWITEFIERWQEKGLSVAMKAPRDRDSAEAESD